MAEKDNILNYKRRIQHLQANLNFILFNEATLEARPADPPSFNFHRFHNTNFRLYSHNSKRASSPNTLSHFFRQHGQAEKHLSYKKLLQFHVPDPGFYPPKPPSRKPYAKVVGKRSLQKPIVDSRQYYEDDSSNWLKAHGVPQLDKQISRDDVVNFWHPQTNTNGQPKGKALREENEQLQKKGIMKGNLKFRLLELDEDEIKDAPAKLLRKYNLLQFLRRRKKKTVVRD